MAHTTVNSGTFISGTHITEPFDGSQNHGHQFRGVYVEPEHKVAEEAPVEIPAEEIPVVKPKRVKKA